jgi:hypothetical protein
MLRKLALFGLVLALLIGVIEGAARMVVRRQAPVWVRDGLYENPLPLVTSEGGAPIDLAYLPRGDRRLPEAKAPGELRVAVLGESSVAGSPLDTLASMPAMLLDELRRVLPGRDLTVINMGRPGSISANVYYYLVYLRRFAPDYVVFYMGMNDDPFTPGEQCLLGEHPRLAAAWRGLVESSWAVWLTRVWGVQHLWRITRRSEWYPPRDCRVPTYEAWTELLVRFAQEHGARVVIANPICNPLRLADLRTALVPDPVRPSTWGREARELLACALEDECDLDARVAAYLAEPVFPMLPSWRMLFSIHVGMRSYAWEAAARATGASHIPFDAILAALSPHGLPSAGMFSDWLRLNPRAYLLLARLIAARVAGLETGHEPPPPGVLPSQAEVDPYLDATFATGMRNVFEQLRFRAVVSAVPGLKYYLSVFSGPRCERRGNCRELEAGRQVLAWLRWQAGLDPGLPSEQAQGLPAYDPLASDPRLNSLGPAIP